MIYLSFSAPQAQNSRMTGNFFDDSTNPHELITSVQVTTQAYQEYPTAGDFPAEGDPNAVYLADDDDFAYMLYGGTYRSTLPPVETGAACTWKAQEVFTDVQETHPGGGTLRQVISFTVNTEFLRPFIEYEVETEQDTSLTEFMQSKIERDSVQMGGVDQATGIDTGWPGIVLSGFMIVPDGIVGGSYNISVYATGNPFEIVSSKVTVTELGCS